MRLKGRDLLKFANVISYQRGEVPLYITEKYSKF